MSFLFFEKARTVSLEIMEKSHEVLEIIRLLNASKVAMRTFRPVVIITDKFLTIHRIDEETAKPITVRIFNAHRNFINRHFHEVTQPIDLEGLDRLSLHCMTVLSLSEMYSYEPLIE